MVPQKNFNKLKLKKNSKCTYPPKGPRMVIPDLALQMELSAKGAAIMDRPHLPRGRAPPFD